MKRTYEIYILIIVLVVLCILCRTIFEWFFSLPKLDNLLIVSATVAMAVFAFFQWTASSKSNEINEKQRKLNEMQIKLQRAFVFLEDFKADVRPNSNPFTLALMSDSTKPAPNVIYIESLDDGLSYKYIDEFNVCFKEGIFSWAELYMEKTDESIIIAAQKIFLYKILKLIGSLGHQLWMEYCSLIPIWKNNGNTLAKNIRILTQWRIVDGDIPPVFPVPPENRDIPGVPVKTQSIYLGPKSSCLSERIEIPAGTASSIATAFLEYPPAVKNIFVWAKAEYEDTFGEKHFTENCYRLQFRAKGQYCPIEASFIQCGSQNCADEDKGWLD